MSNKDTKYSPSRSHSNKVEAAVWTMPILIIIFLAVLTQKTTHALEPSKPLVHDEKPITIETVSMDWRWFFIYPEQGIVAISEIAFPANTPMYLRMTPSSVVNSFFIPCLGSQIYAMVGIQTRLHLITDKPGIYGGISASYSGPGFSGIKFKAIATPNRAEFNQWVAETKQSPDSTSDIAVFGKLAAPNEYNQVEYFSSVRPDLFADVISKFMARGKSMDMTQLEGKHSTHEDMGGMGMSRAGSTRQRG